MSIEHMAIVLHHSTLKGTAKLVLLGIANHAGDGGAWPAVDTLATYAACSPRQVQRGIQAAVSAGELRVTVQGGGDAACPDYKRPNRYDLRVSCPPWCDRSPNHKDTRRLAGPQTGMDLWINRVTPTSPGDTHVTGSGDTGVTQTVHMNQDPTRGPALTTDRARDARPGPVCSVCSQDEPVCLDRNARVSLEDRHPFTPKGGR